MTNEETFYLIKRYSVSHVRTAEDLKLRLSTKFLIKHLRKVLSSFDLRKTYIHTFLRT